MKQKWWQVLVMGFFILIIFGKSQSKLAAQDAPTPNAQNVELVGQIGGTTRAVTVQGDYAYMGVGPRLVILNVADPSKPTFVGQTAVLPQLVNDIEVVGSYAYVVAGKGVPYKAGYAVGEGEGGLYIFEVTNPALPIGVGVYRTENTAFGITVFNDIAYIANGKGGLRIIDVSNPTSPTEIGYHETPGSSAQDVAIAGNIAYLAAGWLRLIDVSDLRSPTELSHIRVSALNVDINGHFAYVSGGSGSSSAAGNGRMYVIDISNPNSPTKIAEHFTGNAPSFGVAVHENLAYAVGENGELRLFDVSNPTTVTELGLYDMAESAEDIVVAGTIAYVADGGGGLRLIDVSNPAAPVEVGFYDTLGGAQEVTIAGNIAYVVDAGSHPYHPTGGSSGLSLRAFNVSDPRLPTEIVNWENAQDAGTAVYEIENMAYVLFSSALFIIDASNQTSLKMVGYFSTTPSHMAWDFAMSENTAFIVDGGGLLAVDVSNPTQPTEVGRIELDVSSVEVADNIAYIVAGLDLRVYDVSYPANPVEIGVYNPPSSSPYHIALAESVAYILDSSRMYVIDVANPTEPKQVGVFDPTYGMSGMTSVTAFENNVFLAAEREGLHVIDASNPTSPVEVDYFDTPGNAQDVTVVDDIIYVASGYGGIFTLRYVEGKNDNILDPVTPSQESLPTPTISVAAPTAVSLILETTEQLTDETNETAVPATELEPKGEPTEQSQTSSLLPVTAGVLAGLVILIGGGILLRRRKEPVTIGPATGSHICPYCGAENPAHGRFCTKCGQPRKNNSK